MDENRTISAETQKQGGTIKKHYKGVCIKLYLSPEKFIEIAKDAEKTGKRRVGLQLWTQKPHGFQWERLANTDGIAKAFKFWYEYWKEAEPRRQKELQDLQEQEKKIAEEKRKLGVTQ